jgi:hypothetical protein
MENRDGVRWPPHYAPENSPVHVRNELVMHVAAEAVWAWLIRARLWPTWYPNSANVVYLQGASPRGRDFGGKPLA